MSGAGCGNATTGTRLTLRHSVGLDGGCAWNSGRRLRTRSSRQFWLSWIAVPIALVTTWAIAGCSRMQRRSYWIAGMLGGLIGEFCAANALFLSFSLRCRHQISCNTAQGELALIFLIPLGTCSGGFLASFLTWLTLRITEISPSNVIFGHAVWVCSLLLQSSIFGSITWFLAESMA